MPLGEQGYANALFDLSGMALHSLGSDVGIGPCLECCIGPCLECLSFLFGMLQRPLVDCSRVDTIEAWILLARSGALLFGQ